MKKRLLALFLCLVMCVGLLPASAFAQEGDAAGATDEILTFSEEAPAEEDEDIEEEAAEPSEQDEMHANEAAEPEDGSDREEPDGDADPGSDPDGEDASDEMPEVILAEQTIRAAIISGDSAVSPLSVTDSVILDGVMPEDAEVTASPVDVEIEGITVLAAYDIKIYDADGNPYQPQEGAIDVTISSPAIQTALEEDAVLSVYHMETLEDEAEEVDVISAGEEGVEFAAESFSIYVVGEDGSLTDMEGQEHYVYTLNFYVESIDHPISTQTVSGGEHIEPPSVPDYDGYVFVGWYSEPDGAGTLYDLETDSLPVITDEQNHEINLYAHYVPRVYVHYMTSAHTEGDDNTKVVFHTEAYDPGTALDTSRAEEYMLAKGYLSSVDTSTGAVVTDRAVTGWVDEDGNAWRTGDTVNADLELYPVIEEAHWIYFNVNGVQVTEEPAPEYVLAGSETIGTGVTNWPDQITAAGYTFEGWYTAADDSGFLVTENTNPKTLPENDDGTVTLYAHWSPARVGYTVNIWRQKATDGQEGLDQKVVQDGEEYATYIQYYDYAESITISADSDIALTTGATGLTSSDFVYTYTTGSGRNERTYTNDYWGDWTSYGWTSSSDGTGDYVGFEYDQARTENNLSTITVKADGSTIINIFYDRVTVTYNFGSGTSGSSITTYGTLIGLYDTNIKVDADNAAGTLNEWPDPPSSGRGWVFSYSRGRSMGVSFLAKYTLESNTVNASNVVNFTTSSSSGNGTLYYYLEVTDPDRQVTSSSTTKTMRNSVTYVLDQAISVPSGTFYFSDKYIGYEYYGYATTNSTTTITTTGTSRNLSNGGSLYIFNNAIEYTIELYSNHNGEQLVWSDSYKYGTPMSSDIFPTELDAETYGPAYYYHFTGIWYEDPTFTAEFVMPDTMPANNLVAYADWELNDVEVTFVTGADDVKAPETQNIKATETAADPGVLEREGYTHVGWVDQNGKVFNFDTVLYADTTLTAIWKSENETGFLLTYDLNVENSYGLLDDHAGGTTSTNPEHFAGDDFEELWTIEHAFSGLDSDVYGRFICWNTEPDGSGTSYYPDDEIYIEEDTTLYAIWAHENESTLILDHNYPDGYVKAENDSEYDEVTQSNLESIELDEVSTLEVGDEIEVVDEYGVTHTYRFAGWSTEKTSAENATDEDVEFEVDAVIAVDNTTDDGTGNTLYAVWIEVPSIPITVEKIWNDGDDETGIRPESVTVTLYADGVEVDSAELTAQSDWSCTFTVLEEDYSDATAWTVAEDEITLENGDHYEPAYSVGDDGALIITNTLTGTWDSVAVSKVWEDDEDHDNIRPESVEIGLYANGAAVTDEKGEIVEVTLSEENRTESGVRTWAGSFSDLPKYDENGKLIDYTVTELEIPDGYISVPYGTAETGFTVVNTHEDYMATITVTKTWDDGEWGDIYRPEEVTVHLYADGTELDENTEPPLVLTAENAVEGDPNVWTGTFEKSVYVYEVTSEGTIEVSYTVNEDNVAAYETTKDGVVTLTPDESSETGWSGSVAITNHLETIDDEPGEEPEPGGGDEEIVGPVTISKTWVDEYDTHDNIEVTIFSSNWQENGEPVISKTVTLSENDSWTAVVTGLPKYKTDGAARIEYAVTEINVTGYETTGGELVPGDDGTYAAEFVNTQLINTGNDDPADDGVLTVTKVWDDADDQDGLRPASVRVALSVNGQITDYIVTLSGSSNWTGTFVGLPAYQLDEDGNTVPVEYTVVEGALGDYTTGISGGEETEYKLTVTNSHTPILINEEEDDDPDNDGVLTVTKVWNDNNDQDGRRPASVTVNLLADGGKVAEMTLTAADGWTGSFTGLEKYRDGGVEIVYTVTENAEEDYTANYETAADGYEIVNSYEPEMTTVTVTKAWDDGNDWDGLRPDEVSVTLTGSDGSSQSLTLNEENKWTATADVPVYHDGGARIGYSVTEEQVDGYEAPVVTSGNGYNFTVTNTHEPLLINTEDSDPNNDGKISVEKIWDDAEDQDGMRPKSVTIVLTGTVGENEPEVVIEKSAELNEDSGWAYTFEELYKYHEGEEVSYTITEIAVENYDAPVIDGNIAEGFTVTNTHEPLLVNTGDGDPDNDGKITITKVWEDNNDRDGIRPGSVAVNLLANGVPVDTAELAPERAGLFARIAAFFTGRDLSEENDWSFTFEDLPMYSGGEEIVYTVEEIAIDGYDSEITGDTEEGFTVTNTHDPVLVNAEDEDPDNDGVITVTKVWDDDNDRDGLRPSEITVTLLADGGETGDALTLSAANGWTGEFTGLYAYENGELLTYTVVEGEVKGYDAKIAGSMGDGYIITNAHDPELINQGTKNEGILTVTKVWDDNDDQDGKRPASVTVNLLADGEEINEKTLTAADGWTGSFTGLYKYSDGKEIEYTVTETAVEDYSTSYDEKNYVITNSYTPSKTSVTVVKDWEDGNDWDGARPDEVTVTLYADGAEAGSLTLTAKDNWVGSFTELDEYAGGEKIIYTVAETDVPEGYTSAVSGDALGGYTVTNTHEPVLINTGDDNPDNDGRISVEKMWDDADDQDGMRPRSVTVVLTGTVAGGEPEVVVEESAELDENNDWTYTFEELYAFHEGKAVSYTITEIAVQNYDAPVVDGDIANGFTITNTHEPLLVNTGDDDPDNDGKITITKVWEDDNDRDGIRPDSVTVNLLADGVPVDTAELAPERAGLFARIAAFFSGADLSEDNGWSFTFEDLPMYADGEEIVYTVQEAAVDGYDSAVTGSTGEGFTITNTHDPVLINTEDEDPDNDGVITVTKVWNDNDDQDGKRPEEITVTLLANGSETGYTLTLSDKDGWEGTFEGLYAYADGKLLTYTVVEEETAGYVAEIAGSMGAGYTITNTHGPELINEGTENEGILTVTKVWDDNNDQDGMRPSEVTVSLLADGSVTDTMILSDKDGWEGTFEGLYAYADGKKLNYTVTEDGVSGYTAEITGSSEDGYTVTNTHEPILINTEDDDPTNDGVITVTKIWNDDDDRDGKRPTKITVSLLANGIETGYTLTLSEENGWKGEFTDLYAYANGKLLTYTVIESGAEGYYDVTNGSMRDGYTITNTYDPELINQGTENEGKITVTKDWDDDNDRDGLRIEEITVVLLDGTGGVAGTMVLSDENGWTGTFEGLYAYANGQLLNYTVIEETVNGYYPEIAGSAGDGYTITNTHAPILINEDDDDPDNDGVISVEKVWQDSGNADGLRPSEGITVILYADGEYSDSLTLSDGNGWSGSFTDLPAYSEGKEIAYSISEIAADGYKTEVAGSMTDGYTVTNTQLVNTGYDPVDPDDPNPDPDPRFDDDPENDGIISVEKVWNDADNADDLRPDSIEVILYAGDEAVDSLTLTAADGWVGSFTDLPKYDEDNNVMIYTVSEIAAEGYKTEVTGSSADGYTVTNTQLTNTGIDPTDPNPNPQPDPDPENDGVVSVEKVWVDGNNADDLRPGSITVALYANGRATGDALVLDASNGWSGSFTDLPKYDSNSQAIIYSISEISVDGYKTEVTGSSADGYIVTNTQLVNTGTDPTDPDPNPSPDPDPDNDGVITVTKVWNDNDNADNIRPDSVTVTLLANGAAVDSLTLTAADGWTGSFTDLPKYGSDDEMIIYTVSEAAAEGYKSEVTGSDADGYTVTNTQLTNTGTDPADPSPNPRPDPDPENDGIISVEKVWVDGNNADGLRPDSITVALIVNGEITDETLELSEASGWTGSFTGLPKYDDDNEALLYSVTEITADGYKTEMSGSNADGYVVTNTQLVNTGTDPTDPNPNPNPDTDPDNDGIITVKKVWVDGSNADGLRPDSVTVTLLADGETVDSLVLSAENGWTGSFTDLPKYGSDSEVVIYTVTEAEPESYKSEVTGSTAGFAVTNTQLMNTGTDPTDPDPNPSPDTDPENDGIISVEKVWNDGDNEDNARPDTVTVVLTADGETADMMTLSGGSGWSGSFTDLPKYNEDGGVIAYGIIEADAAGYSSEIAGSNAGGYTVTNTLLVNGGGKDLSDDGLVTVSKVWKDDNNSEGLRPEEITVTLYADGEAIGSISLTAGDGWTGSFEDLPAYNADGKEISYTVTENEIVLDSGDAYVAGYEYNGQGSAVITNTLTGVWGGEPEASGEPSDPNNPGASETTGVTVEKTWQDNNDQDGLRPTEINVTLFADGGDTGLTVTLSGENGWTGSFGTLDKYDANGVMIDYAVAEDDVPEGYICAAGGSAELGFTVTNIHDPALVNGDGVLSVTKTWDDNNNALSVRPNEIVLQLTANGDPVENETLTLTAADNWTGSFTDLPAYADGEEITYSVTETGGSHYYEATMETLYEEDGTYSLAVTNQIDLVFFPIDEEIVVDENDPDSWIGNESVNEYEMIEIEMTTTLPAMSGEELANGEFTMTFHDVLDSALNLDEADADFSVYIAGVQVGHQYYTVVTETDDDCSFHVTVDLTALYNDGVITNEDLQGNTEITVFFYADLEGTGLNGSYTSTVWYDVYNGDELLYTSNVDVVEVYTFDIDIVKYDASALEGEDYAGAALAGAVLGVYYDNDCTDAVVRSGDDFTAVSDENGLTQFAGLAEGTYYVKEIQTPDGYELSDEVLEVTLGTELENHVWGDVFANTPAEAPAEPEAPAETAEPEEPATPAGPEQTTEPEATAEPEQTAEPEEPAASEEPSDGTDESASAEPVTEVTSGGSGTASGESTSPQTGDENSLLFFAAMVLLCGAALVGVVVVRRKRTDK